MQITLEPYCKGIIVYPNCMSLPFWVGSAEAAAASNTQVSNKDVQAMLNGVLEVWSETKVLSESFSSYSDGQGRSVTFPTLEFG